MEFYNDYQKNESDFQFLSEKTKNQLYFVCDLKIKAMRKEKTTAAETPALAAAREPVSA